MNQWCLIPYDFLKCILPSLGQQPRPPPAIPFVLHRPLSPAILPIFPPTLWVISHPTHPPHTLQHPGSCPAGGWAGTGSAHRGCQLAGVPAGKSLSEWKTAKFTCFPQWEELLITSLQSDMNVLRCYRRLGVLESFIPLWYLVAVGQWVMKLSGGDSQQIEDRWVLGDNYKITKLKVQNDQAAKRSKEICSDGRQI